jgi:hypothetical protein
MKVCLVNGKYKINGEINEIVKLLWTDYWALNISLLAQSTRLEHCSIGPEPIILRPTINSTRRLVLH